MKAFYLFKKDWESELRTRYAINALAMFILVTISVILFSIGQERINEYLTGGLLWVVIFFSAMSGLARAFVSEEERGTTMTLHLIASPTTVFSGKLIFNLILVFLMNIVISILFSMLFEAFIIKNFLLFVIAFIFGNIGIGVSSTIISAIISKANTKPTAKTAPIFIVAAVIIRQRRSPCSKIKASFPNICFMSAASARCRRANMTASCLTSR